MGNERAVLRGSKGIMPPGRKALYNKAQGPKSTPNWPGTEAGFEFAPLP